MEDKAMKKTLRWILLLVFAAILSLPLNLYADTYTTPVFQGCDWSIWDISGCYSDDSVGCDISFCVAQDGKGKFTGGGSATCSIEGIDIDMNYDVMGSVKQSGSTTTVKISLKATGTASYGSDTFKFTANEKATLEIDCLYRTMTGTMTAKISIKGLGSESETFSFSEPLPTDMDGSWFLEFDVYENGSRLIGTGELELSNERIIFFDVKGKYSSKTDESKFGLKGNDDDSKGCKIKIAFDESLDHIIYMKAKVLGQKPNYTQ